MKRRRKAGAELCQAQVWLPVSIHECQLSFSIWQNIKVAFPKCWCCVPFSNILRSFLLWKRWAHLTFDFFSFVFISRNKIEVVFHLRKDWGRLPFENSFRSSSIWKKIKNRFLFGEIIWGCLPFVKKIFEVVFHLWRKKLSRLP